MGLGQNYAADVTAAATPVATFGCPTRRPNVPSPFLNDTNFLQFPTKPPLLAHSDYAANSGDGPVHGVGPEVKAGSSGDFYSVGDGMTDAAWVTLCYSPGVHNTGAIYRHGQCAMAEITDGASNTFLIGERYCWPDHYSDGGDLTGDDQGWMEGYDYDTNRWVQVGDITKADPADRGYLPPQQDTPGYKNELLFGSAHANGFGMAFCDGSVQRLNYTIDAETYRRLGNREDGLPADPKKL